jgi:hypothetical protein
MRTETSAVIPGFEAPISSGIRARRTIRGSGPARGPLSEPLSPFVTYSEYQSPGSIPNSVIGMQELKLGPNRADHSQ